MDKQTFKSRGLLQRFAKPRPFQAADVTRTTSAFIDDSFSSMADELYEQKEAHWAKRQKELEERLKYLAARKQSLPSQKEVVQTAAQDPTRQPKQAEEMQLLLELSKAELTELQQTVKLERFKTTKLEQQIEAWRRRCEHLDKSNRSLTLLMVSKDKQVSSYLSELQRLRYTAGQLGKGHRVEELLQEMDDALARIEVQDVNIDDEVEVGRPGGKIEALMKQLADLTQQKNKRIKELEDELEIRNTAVQDKRLEKQSLQVLEVSRLKREKLSEKTSVIKRHQTELDSLRGHVHDLSDEHHDISDKYFKHVSKREHEQQTESGQVEELRRLRDDYETQLAKLERRHQEAMTELETGLKVSRARILELIEEKAALDNEVFISRNDQQALRSQLDVKEAKLTEVLVSLQDLRQEAGLAKADKDRAVEKMREAQRMSDSYADQIVELKQSALELRTGASELDHARSRLENEVTVLRREVEAAKKNGVKEVPPQGLDSSIQQAIRQLSLIILSKEKATYDSGAKSLVKSAFGEDFIHLVSTYETKLREETELKERAEDARVNEMKRELGCLSRLQEADETLVSLINELEEGGLTMNPDELSAKKAEVLGRIKATELQMQALRQTLTHNTDPLRSSAGSVPAVDTDDLKVRISSQATEIMSLRQTIRTLHSTESQRSSVDSFKVDQERQRLNSENEMLKEELSKAMTSLEELGDIVGKLQATANTEDFALFLQCSANVVEELIRDQMVEDEHDIEELLRE
jgi:predicted  nucleic acid-binding Zn-ribbon protein